MLAQLSADSGSTSGPQLTPEDEQNARLKAGQQTIDLLSAQFQLSQAKVNLLRQTGPVGRMAEECGGDVGWDAEWHGNPLIAIVSSMSSDARSAAGEHPMRLDRPFSGNKVVN